MGGAFMGERNYRQVEFSRFVTSQRLAMLLLSQKDLSNCTPEKLADDFVEVTRKIDSIISNASFEDTGE